MVFSFTVLGEPQGKARPRFTSVNGHVRAYTTKQTADYEKSIITAFKTQGGERFADSAMLSMQIFAFYGIPKSATKKKREMMLKNELRPTKKPDMDNVCKVVCDALNDVAYHDDVQIVECTIRKFYAETPRVCVAITEV